MTDKSMPAFPKTPFVEIGTPQNGMTLRDYFAAKAMVGLLGRGDTRPTEITQVAYIIADAMLKAREQ